MNWFNGSSLPWKAVHAGLGSIYVKGANDGVVAIVHSQEDAHMSSAAPELYQALEMFAEGIRARPLASAVSLFPYQPIPRDPGRMTIDVQPLKLR